ncbi:MAG: hypothetical protein COU51_02520 [Parcubacteria group bacterium CG10_big_fil_rev_8_21_14_0_10_36_14]|nr:MAG: hypothetical protein COU51_02520 [Parcubacteria group bacterium CG10_big_fil_rev_8_21_14_0_10_36_14]
MWQIIFGGTKKAKNSSVFTKIILWILAGSCSTYIIIGLLIGVAIIGAMILLAQDPISLITQ